MNGNKNYGILKPNQSDNPRAPSLKGSLHIDGKTYWVSAWHYPNGTGKFNSKLEHVPHYQLNIDLAEDTSHHVGGQNFRSQPSEKKSDFTSPPPSASKIDDGSISF